MDGELMIHWLNNHNFYLGFYSVVYLTDTVYISKIITYLEGFHD